MGDRCCSTLICAERDNDVFEKMGYRLEESQALPADGNEIPGAVVMVDEESDNETNELTALTGIPFLVCNGSCPGVYTITSLFRTAGNGTTPKLYMRATIPRFESNSEG